MGRDRDPSYGSWSVFDSSKKFGNLGMTEGFDPIQYPLRFRAMRRIGDDFVSVDIDVDENMNVTGIERSVLDLKERHDL